MPVDVICENTVDAGSTPATSTISLPRKDHCTAHSGQRSERNQGEQMPSVF